MRILLVGEYSRFHNSLKEGLVALGHDVVIIGDNDFKNYPLDISVYAKTFKKGCFLNKIRQGIFRLFKIDVAQIEIAFRFYANRKKLTGFDVVQLVNEYPLQSNVVLEKKILQYLFKNNKKIFLSSCGDDYVSVKHMLEDKFRYSVLTPCKENPNLGHCQYTLRYVTKPFEELHKYVYENISAVIPADLDYAIPLENHPKAVPLIPYPINVDKNEYSPLLIDNKVIIFHGINEANYYKKGNAFFEKALEVIEKKYADKVEIITTRSIPYATYIELYNKANILLDQAYSYDQGYNALEAMAKGKVVFTGAEKEFTAHYNLNERVCVNALADVDYLVKELSGLIDNPEEIMAIGKRARTFIEKEHDYKIIANRYLETWGNN
ncbi:MAG TPA: glycosyltransferase [Flavobacterium sp.]|uniref:glycosyltransferase n=1 Tax=Flavobacterium sp. TaxID=239 RepID=UPI002F40AE9E